MKSSALSLGVVAAVALAALAWRHQSANRQAADLRAQLEAAVKRSDEIQLKLTHQEQAATAGSNLVQELQASAAAQSNVVATLQRQLREAEQRTAAGQNALSGQAAVLSAAREREETLRRELAEAERSVQAAVARQRELGDHLQSVEDARLQMELRARREAAERERLLWSWNDLAAVEARKRWLEARPAPASSPEDKDKPAPGRRVETAGHGAIRLLQLPSLPPLLDDGRPLELQPDGSVRPAGRSD